MVAAKMPDEPLELERLSMYGFGAIPNLEACLSSDAPLKRRLRPRRAKSDETAKDVADLVIVSVKPRQRQKPSSWPPTKEANSSSLAARQRILKPKSGDKSLPIEIPHSEKVSNPGI